MIETPEQLEQQLTNPSPELINAMASLSGDILILGVGGKMGPTLAQLAVNACRQAGVKKRVIGVSRFSAGDTAQKLQQGGVETISADLLDDNQLQQLPDVENVIYMVGFKFGSTGNEHLTWVMNAYLPGRVAQRFPKSRTVVFSTGNVYHLTPLCSGGATEDTPTAPVGEYAQSALGRERVFEYFSRRNQTPMLIYRLNYANDLRYGVLLDVAQAVYSGQPVDLAMGYANVIWQGDANEVALRSLLYTSCPPRILNVTGPETVSIRWLAEQFAGLMGTKPVFTGAEAGSALLSNASRAHQLFGYPRVNLRQMIEWTAHWVQSGGATLGKPTHFQERQGKF